MRFSPRFLAIAIAALFMGPMLVCSQDAHVRLTVTVVAANSEETPLRILGFRLPESVGDRTTVVVHNVSSKSIRAFWVEVATYPPEGESSRGNGRNRATTSNSPNWEWPQEILVPPRGRADAQVVVLHTNTFVSLARQVQTNCLHAIALVLRVDFIDGTSWRYEDKATKRRIWEDSKGSASGGLCHHESKTEGVLRRVEGAGKTNLGTATQLESSLRESYSFSCDLREVRGKVLAFCPF